MKRDETTRKMLLQKKLNQKKFLTEDVNKLLNECDSERHKNKIPGVYVSFCVIETVHNYLNTMNDDIAIID